MNAPLCTLISGRVGGRRAWYAAPVIPQSYFRLCVVVTAWVLAAAAGANTLPTVELQPVADGFTVPLAMSQMPDGQSLVVDQLGWIYAFGKDGRKADDVVADLRDQMVALNPSYDERGLLDVVLHPQFQKNRRLYLAYNAPLTSAAPTNWNCSLVISEFVLPPNKPLVLDRGSEKVLLRIDKPYGNHNGGRMAFGADGLLYIGVGDGGAANDQGLRPAEGNGQNLQTLLGKVLRVDVDHGNPYSIPKANPFADGRDGLPEIYSYGFRNPWGLSFDRGGSHELFLADVGQNQFEEVDIVLRGGNYGWNRREGFHAFDPEHPDAAKMGGASIGARGEPLLDPIAEYPHHDKNHDAPQGVSVIGGYVYRGQAIPGLNGRFVFADWTRTRGAAGDGRLVVASRPATGNHWDCEYLPVRFKPGDKWINYITALAQDNQGELFVLTCAQGQPGGTTGRIWKMVLAR